MDQDGVAVVGGVPGPGDVPLHLLEAGGGQGSGDVDQRRDRAARWQVVGVQPEAADQQTVGLEMCSEPLRGGAQRARLEQRDRVAAHQDQVEAPPEVPPVAVSGSSATGSLSGTMAGISIGSAVSTLDEV